MKTKLFHEEFEKAKFPEELWIWNDVLSSKGQTKLKPGAIACEDAQKEGKIEQIQK